LHITQQLASQQQLAREATQELAQVTTDNYMGFLDSVFSFYQGGTSRTRRRAEEAQRRIEEAQRQTEEAKRSTGEALRRVKEAEKSTRAAQRRAKEAERSLEEAQRRTLEAERRAEEAETSRSETESQGGDDEGDTEADAVRHPLSNWMRTSGRSKVRGRNTRSQGRSSRRR
jgi:chromosome segregation ATPase